MRWEVVPDEVTPNGFVRVLQGTRLEFDSNGFVRVLQGTRLEFDSFNSPAFWKRFVCWLRFGHDWVGDGFDIQGWCEAISWGHCRRCGKDYFHC